MLHVNISLSISYHILKPKNVCFNHYSDVTTKLRITIRLWGESESTDDRRFLSQRAVTRNAFPYHIKMMIRYFVHIIQQKLYIMANWLHQKNENNMNNLHNTLLVNHNLTCYPMISITLHSPEKWKQGREIHWALNDHLEHNVFTCIFMLCSKISQVPQGPR